MPPPLISGKKIYEVAQTIPAQDATRILHDMNIAPSTLKNYESKVRLLAEFISAAGQPRLTKQLFTQYLAALVQLQAHHNSDYAKHLRCALLHYQLSRGLWLLPGERPWANDPDILRACSGFRYQSKTGAPVRGQITNDMFLQLLNFVRQRVPVLIYPIIVLYGTGLRIGALIQIKAQHYQHDTSLLSYPDKAANALNRKPVWATREVRDPDAREVLRRMSLTVNPTECLFSKERCPITVLRDTIKLAQRTFNWDPSLEFVGPHSLRHGAAIHLQEFATNLQDVHQLINMSPTTYKYYSRPNATRKRNRDSS